jgi:hypothetical protein
MDGLTAGDRLVERVRVGNRAIFDAGSAAAAFIFPDIPGFLDEPDFEVPRLTLDRLDLGMGEDLYVFLPADLDQFR